MDVEQVNRIWTQSFEHDSDPSQIKQHLLKKVKSGSLDIRQSAAEALEWIASDEPGLFTVSDIKELSRLSCSTGDVELRHWLVSAVSFYLNHNPDLAPEVAAELQNLADPSLNSHPLTLSEVYDIMFLAVDRSMSVQESTIEYIRDAISQESPDFSLGAMGLLESIAVSANERNTYAANALFAAVDETQEPFRHHVILGCIEVALENPAAFSQPEEVRAQLEVIEPEEVGLEKSALDRAKHNLTEQNNA